MNHPTNAENYLSLLSWWIQIALKLSFLHQVMTCQRLCKKIWHAGGKSETCQINFSSTADPVSLYSSITGLSLQWNYGWRKRLLGFLCAQNKKACRTEHRIIFKITLFCVFVFLWGIYNFTSCIWNDHIMPAFPSSTCANRNILNCSSEGCGSSML